MFSLLLDLTMQKRSVYTRKEPKQQVRLKFLFLGNIKPDIGWMWG